MGKSIPSKGNRRCKGPEAGTGLVHLRSNKKARVAELPEVRGKEARKCQLI